MAPDVLIENPFEKTQLKAIVLGQLEALGWIDEVSQGVQMRVSDMIDCFERDRELSRLLNQDPPAITKAMERVCLARMNQLDNHQALKHINLERLGLKKSKQDALPEVLYPVILLEMIERVGFPVLATLAQCFEARESAQTKYTKKSLLEDLESALKKVEMSPALSRDLTEALSKLLSRLIGRRRLGEMLYGEDAHRLKQWEAKFPSQSKEVRLKEELAALPTKTEVVDHFFKSIRYFAGNPHVAPGVFNTFRNQVWALVGDTQKKYVTCENGKSQFTIRIKGAHNIDIERVQSFKQFLEQQWVEKFGKDESLVIELDLQSGGGDGGAFIDI